MSQFDQHSFTLKLVAETLFYDEEYGALGNLSLIDEAAHKERYIAAYSPEDDRFIVEEATEWEDYTPSNGDDVGYAFAANSKEHRAYTTADEAASEIIRLAKAGSLTPSITILFEQDDIV